MYINNNMNSFINTIKNNPNPQGVIMGMLQEQSKRDPMFSNLMNLVQKGDTEGIERIARNVVQERGLDFDKEFNSFKQMFRNF